MKNKKIFVAILLGLLVMAGNAFCDSIILGVTQDATVFAPNVTQGSWDEMRVRWQSADDWGRNYPLIEFDLTGLPNNIAVNYARFAFWTHTQDDSNPYWPAADDFPLLSMYKVTSSWSDAGGTQPSIDPVAVDTQDAFDPGGAGNIFTAPDTIVADKAAWIFFHDVGSAALVQNWANGVTDNNGVEVRGTGAYTDTSRYFHFISSDHPTTSVRPYLYVDYTVIPEPATLGFIGLLAAMFITRKR